MEGYGRGGRDGGGGGRGGGGGGGGRGRGGGGGGGGRGRGGGGGGDGRGRGGGAGGDGRGRGGGGGGDGRGRGGGGDGRGRGGGGDGRGRGGGGGGGGGYQHQQQFQPHNDQYRQAPQQSRGSSSSSSQAESYAPPSEGGSGWTQVGSARPAPSEAWKTGAWGTGAGGAGGGRGGGGGGGGGRGSVWGRGQQVSVQSSPTRSPEPDHDSIIPEMRSLEISKQSPPSSALNKKIEVPVKRPDNGGTSCIRPVRLIVNHFPVNFNPESRIWHYDVDVKPVVPSSGGRAPKITKSNLCMIRNKLFSDGSAEFPLSMTAYDGEKNIFSAVPLPTGEFPVDLSDGEGMRIRSFTFSIKLVNELKLCKLKKYLCGNLFSIPRDILQGMDVVMKENPGKRMITVGRSFYPAEFHPQDDLGYGLAGSRGFQHSLKPTSQGLSLCLDSSVLAFRKRIPVLEFLQEHIGGLTITNFRKFRRQAESTLKRLKVTVTHRITKQKFTIAGLTDQDTRNLSFTEVDPEGIAPPKQVSIVEYFQKKYGKNIMYQDIPCLDLGKNNKANHVPMEFCVLLEGQKYPKEDLERLDKRAAMFLKEISLPSPMERMNRINSMVRAEDGPCGGGIANNFGIEVNTNMTRVEARVIGPPELRQGGQRRFSVDREKCQWNLVGKSVVEGKPIERWAVIDFSANERFNRLDPNNFIPKLIARCNNLGMRMGEPLIYEPCGMNLFSNVSMLQECLEYVAGEASKQGKGSLQIIVCVMSRKDPGYKFLKWISETKVGIVTQCCLSAQASKAQDQYLANLALKINAKLGGSNVELSDRLPYFEGKDHVMFIGADVNHPGSGNKTSPSIAAVVGTVNWPAANRYAARVRAQYHRKEKIVDFGEICMELIENYARLNKAWPKKIVIFRDGVSEGQFDMVLNEELVDLKSVLHSRSYNPTITLIVAQKRHQTRLFPESQRDGGSTGNVSPGTVVDTTIVHPFEFDFFLCSHYGSLGTSKPTHYHVLWDDHRFTSDQLQKLIYYLCFTFARCTKPVSLVPPVYYADLVAYRGRLYYEALSEGQYPASIASSSSSRSATSIEERSYKLHVDLENIMFFI